MQRADRDPDRGAGPGAGRRRGGECGGVRHFTSRAQDPQLHSHAVLLNLCVRADGATGGLDNRAILKNAGDRGPVPERAGQRPADRARLRGGAGRTQLRDRRVGRAGAGAVLQAACGDRGGCARTRVRHRRGSGRGPGCRPRYAGAPRTGRRRWPPWRWSGSVSSNRPAGGGRHCSKGCGSRPTGSGRLGRALWPSGCSAWPRPACLKRWRCRRWSRSARSCAGRGGAAMHQRRGRRRPGRGGAAAPGRRRGRGRALGRGRGGVREPRDDRGGAGDAPPRLRPAGRARLRPGRGRGVGAGGAAEPARGAAGGGAARVEPGRGQRCRGQRRLGQVVCHGQRRRSRAS